MKRHLVAGLLLALTAAPAPARATAITDSDRSVLGALDAAAMAYVRDHRRRLGVADAARLGQLAVTRRVRVGRGVAIHVGQRAAGLPVLGSDVSVLVIDRRIVAATGKLAVLPAAVVVSTPERSLSELAGALRIKGSAVRVRRAHRALLVTRGATRRLRTVYVVDALTTSPFGVWRALVDAADGSLLRATSALRHVEGKAYLPNPVSGSVGTKALLGLGTSEELVGEHADVSRCSLSAGYKLDCSRGAQPDEQGNYLYEPDEPSTEDPFAEVHAYYHVDAFHRWLGERFGFERAGGHAIKVMVNFHFKLAGGQAHGIGNAFFGDIDGDGRGEVVFGQSERDFAYDADVIYHELTHSVIGETSNLTTDFDELGLNMVPGSLNEGFADLMSSALTGDGTVGEYAGGLYGGTSIRELLGEARRCPDDLIGESHRDGLIWGRAIWTARTLASDKAAFDLVLYTTMTSLAERPTFGDAAALLVKVAKSTEPQVAALLALAVKEAGLTECSRIVPLDEQRPREGRVLGTRELYGVQQVPGALQYKIEVPEDAVEMRLRIQAVAGNNPAGKPQLAAYLRQDKPVSIDEYLKPIDVAHRFADDGEHFALGSDAEEPAERLVPGAAYYVLPVNSGEAAGQYELTVAFTRVEIEPRSPLALLGDQPLRVESLSAEPVLPAPGEDLPLDPLAGASVGGNGGCSVTAEPSTGPWGVVLVVLLGLWRRSRILKLW